MGTPSQYTADVKGKLQLFREVKLHSLINKKYAQAAGAAGLIIVNNAEEIRH